MTEYRKGGFDRYDRPASKGRSFFLLTAIVVAIIVLVDFSGLTKVVADNLPGLIQRSEKSAQAEANASSKVPGKNYVITDKDVDQAYKKLLEKRKNQTGNIKTLKADKGSHYRVTLASGRSLLTKEIRSSGDTVTITDNTGMVISLAKEEIAAIVKEKD